MRRKIIMSKAHLNDSPFLQYTLTNTSLTNHNAPMQNNRTLSLSDRSHQLDNLDYAHTLFLKSVVKYGGRNNSNSSKMKFHSSRSNIQNNPTAPRQPFPSLKKATWTLVTLVASHVILFVIGLAGNLISLLAFWNKPSLWTNTNCFLTNLAVADLIYLSCCLLLTVVSIVFEPWILGPSFLCHTVSFVERVTESAAMYSVVAIAAVRCLAICFPGSCPITKRTAWKLIFGIWIFSATMALPWLRYFQHTQIPNDDQVVDDPSSSCIENWPWGRGHSRDLRSYIGLHFLLNSILPFLLVFSSFISVWLYIWRFKALHNNNHSPNRLEINLLVHQLTEAYVLRTLVFVSFVYVLSRVPLYVIFILTELASSSLGPTETKILAVATPCAQLLGALNSAINPIFYAFLNGRFRRAFFYTNRACALNRNGICAVHFGKWIGNNLDLREAQFSQRLGQQQRTSRIVGTNNVFNIESRL